MIPQDLIDYLHTMITPTHVGGESLIILEDLNDHDFSQYDDSQWHGCIAVGTPTEETSNELMRVMKAGAHLMLIAPEEEPTGYKGACQIEDTGFEIRDAIFWARETDPENPNFMYMPKASRSERELGTDHLKKVSGAEAVDRQEGSAGMNNPRAGAGRTASEIGNFHPCLHPRAEVLTDKGYRPIEEINIGDKVYSADGKFHEVEHVSRHPYTSKNLYEIAVKGTNYTTLSSDNHPFLIWRDDQAMWVRGDEVQVGDCTMTPKPKNCDPQCDELLDGEEVFLYESKDFSEGFFVLQEVFGIKEVPYVGDVVNLSVEGSPTFQTAIGMSHNTVKPIGIMEWLARDVPKGATVLDPFMGSGTMGIACVKTGHSYIGTEIDPEYFPIADARIKHWNNTYCAWNSGEVISDLDEEDSESEEAPSLDLGSFLGF